METSRQHGLYLEIRALAGYRDSAYLKAYPTGLLCISFLPTKGEAKCPFLLQMPPSH